MPWAMVKFLKKYDPPLNLDPTYSCWTLDVRIVYFCYQVAVCIKKRHKNAILWCSPYLKLNFDCVLLKLLISSPKTERILYFLCWLSHLLGFQVCKCHSLFGLESQIMTVSPKAKKKSQVIALLPFFSSSKIWKVH